MVALSLALNVLAAAGPLGEQPPAQAQPAPDLVLRCAKVLTMDAQDRVFSPGMVAITDGKIAWVGPCRELPAEVRVIDAPESWASPGMIDLHSHVQTGSWGDINDMVLPTNAELRASAGYVPSNRLVRQALAGGVTTLFGIPGSGTSISGFGLLYKTRDDSDYAGTVIADPGGMKVAQSHNPERRGGDLGLTRAGLYWILQREVARARALNELGESDPRLAGLQAVLRGELPVLIHCAGNDGAEKTVRMWRIENSTRSVLSHGSFDGWHVAKFVADAGMPVNHGPRTMNWILGYAEGRIVGTAAAYVAAGVPDFSLNTDAGVIPQEELFLQGSMSARLGADAYQMLKAVTIHPARAFGIDDRIGSLEPGKDADVVLFRGDPLDPRSCVDLVLIEGTIEYDRRRDGQRF